MSKRDPRVAGYIAKAQEFAKPILSHFRELVHKACPEVTETMKWSFPHFEYKGLLCSMAAFKEHCAIGFWKGKLLFGEDNPKAEEAMGHFGRIKSLDDLPSARELLGYLNEAVRLNELGVKAPARARPRAKNDLVVPDDFLAAMKKNKKALQTFEEFSPSHKRDYVEWITEAKREETKTKRLQTAIEWLSQGKSRNWKYDKR